jgi:hypothetical protein
MADVEGLQSYDSESVTSLCRPHPFQAFIKIC